MSHRSHIASLFVPLLLASACQSGPRSSRLDRNTAASAPLHREVLFATDFETDPIANGWTVSDDFEGGWNRGDAYRGRHRVDIVKGLYKSPDWEMEPNAIYRATFMSRAQGKAYWSMISFNRDGEHAGGHCSGIDPSDEWRRNEVFFIGAANAVRAQFWFHPFRDPFAVDDLRIERATLEQWVEWTEGVRAGLSPVDITPDTSGWKHLPAARDRLRKGQPLSILVLGDSVANDMADSDFHLLLQHRLGLPVTMGTAVSGNAGASWYLQEDRIRERVLPHDADLVILGGMSNRDIDAVRQLVAEIRENSRAEVLVVSGTVVQDRYHSTLNKPATDDGWPTGERTAWRSQLAHAAEEDRFAFFNLGTAWDAYVLQSSQPLEHYKRDNSHVNTRGRAIVAQIMKSFFTAALDDHPAGGRPAGVADRGGNATTQREPAREAADEADSAGEKPIEALVTILGVSHPLTYEHTVPYEDAFRTVQYRVDRLLKGTLEDGTVIGVEKCLENRQPLPAAEHTEGMRFRVRLAPWDGEGEFENYPVSHDFDILDTTWYRVVTSRPVKE